MGRRIRLAVTQVLAWCAMLIPPGAAAQDCALEPASAARGQEIRLNITKPPNVTRAAITFPGRPEGLVPPGDVNGKAARFVVPRLPLGDYTVSAALTIDGKPDTPSATCPPLVLHIVPPAGASLQVFEFQPAGTREFKEVAWTKDNIRETARVANVRIRGSGFITDPEFRDDNRILIDNHLQKVDEWLTEACPPPGTKAPADKAPPLKAFIASASEIQLCDVRFPHHRIAVAVQQPGIAPTPPRTFRLYRWHTGEVAALALVVSLGLALLILLLVKLYKRSQPNPSQYHTLKILLLDLESDTYSLSKCQFYLWTGAAVFGYVYLAISHLVVQGLHWPDIPGSLPAIIGISAGTAVGAQVVSNVRGPKGSGSMEPSVGDLVTSGGVAAADRVQILVWTVVGVGFFLATVVRQAPEEIVTLDKVPDGLMYLMGLSSVGYLGGKLARKAGPIINEISITPCEPDDALAAAAVPPPGVASTLAAAVTAAKSVLASLSAATSGPATLAARLLNTALSTAEAAKTLAGVKAALPVLKQASQDVRSAADAAASAFEANGAPPEAAHQAEIAQRAAAAVDDVLEAAEADASRSGNLAPGVPRFTRSIELRGRHLSSHGLFEIDGVELPFRMLQANPRDPERKRLPEVVVPEPDDRTMAVVLRLTIDPADLEPSDRERYNSWFGTASPAPKLLRLINIDGQMDDLAFTMPPATAQTPVKTNQPAPGQAPDGGAQ